MVVAIMKTERYHIELIKHGPEALFNILAFIFNSFQKEEVFSEILTTTYISNIYQKNYKQDCSNYRSIHVTNSIARMYGKIIKTELKDA